MLASVEHLQNTQIQIQNKLDNLESQIKSNIPEAGPLLDLINRFRVAKTKLINLKYKAVQYRAAEENLKSALSECLEPSANIIQRSCKFPINSLSTTPTLQKFAQRQEQSFNLEPPSLERRTKQITPKKIQSKSPISRMMYREVEEDELATLDTRSYGHISLNDIRELHQYIWDFFQVQDNKNRILQQKQIQDNFPKIRTLRSTLRFLRTLKRIDLTKDGDVKCVLS